MSSTGASEIIRHRTLKTYDWAVKASTSCSESLDNLRPIIRLILHFEEGDAEVTEFTKEQFDEFVSQLGKDRSDVC
ncbi:hypothetical protein KIN20_003300 [Parelaphostrongylus tenuis]|uniref:COMM domain-containing protein n=1 Tax=Parelaphostrongylus tenuis TaxID=148309 RepID=A0AAD5MI60_PARTN|nr:hypothetical protein KIN20_003300 [Parelaphostrongylus tenuis]